MLDLDTADFEWEPEKYRFETPRTYECSYCESTVSSDLGYQNTRDFPGRIYICPKCREPTYFPNEFLVEGPDQVPAPPEEIGSEFEYLPDGIEVLYEEACRCIQAGCFTAAVMVARKLLMHVAVDKGAENNESFAHYIDYLEESGYVAAESKKWVDHIRTTANEANHELIQMTKKDAQRLVEVLDMLLNTLYEVPNKLDM